MDGCNVMTVARLGVSLVATEGDTVGEALLDGKAVDG